MYVAWSFLLYFAAVATAATSPCDLPSLTEVGAQYLIFGVDCRQYAYGYNAGSSAKTEIKDATGTVTGAYHFIDANNITQKVNYTASDVAGFSVSASNLPEPVQDTPEVAQLKDAHAAVVAAVAAEELPKLPSRTLSKLVLAQNVLPSAARDEQILFKPVISVWYPASSYSQNQVAVQHGEILAQKQSETAF